MFRMYNAPRRDVELVCDNSVMDSFIDRFGVDVTTYAWTLDSFRVITEIAVGTSFYNLVFGFQGKVSIRGPEDVKQEYEDMVRNALAGIDAADVAEAERSGKSGNKRKREAVEEETQP